MEIRLIMLLQAIKAINVSTISSIFGNEVVVLLSARDLKSFLRGMTIRELHENIAVCVSMPFYSLNDIRARFEQSQFGIGQGGGAAGVYNIEDYADVLMLSVLRKQNEQVDLLHPALGVLKHYDNEHGTDLYRSFFFFLLHERNAASASSAMKIHRNTLRGRLERITGLLPGVDLESPKVREYIIVSYLMSGENWE